MINKKAVIFYESLISKIPKDITSNICEHEDGQTALALRNEGSIISISFDKSFLTFALMSLKNEDKYCVKGKMPSSDESLHFLQVIIEEFF